MLLGIVCRIIYRTSQERFGRESPDNLKPKVIRPNGITIFINFNQNIAEESIINIYAFPDTRSHELPVLPPDQVHLHKEKVNLNKISRKFVFSGMEDLKSNYATMWL